MFDMKKAFDSVNRSKLFNILGKRCVTQLDAQVVKLMFSLYDSNEYVLGDTVIKSNKGVC